MLNHVLHFTVPFRHICEIQIYRLKAIVSPFVDVDDSVAESKNPSCQSIGLS